MSVASSRDSAEVLDGSVRFEDETRDVLVRLRGALFGLISALPGDVRRAADLSRALDVDTKTSWRLFKIASSTDPLGAGIHVPGRASIKRALKTAERRQVPAEKIGAVADAFDAFEDLVRRVAGDRTTFGTMVSAISDGDDGQTDLTHRRAAFRANSHIWGVQSRAQLVTHILHPSVAKPELFDVGVLQGSFDLRRLRRDATWPIANLSSRHDKGGAVTSAPRPLDESAPTGFLWRFCDQPSAPLRVGGQAAGYANVELLGDRVGIPSESTYLFGHVMRELVPWYRTEQDTHVRTRASTRTPTELLVFDVLVHHDTFGKVETETSLLSDVTRDQRVTDPQKCEQHRLPTRDEAVYLGQGISLLHAPELPRYTEALEWSLERLGWDPESFHAFRCRAVYPVLPSSVVVEFPLPMRDAQF